MADYGEKVADKSLTELSKKLRAVYNIAAIELNKKLAAFRKRFATDQKKMLDDLQNGKISKASYESWLRGKVFTGKRWENKVKQIVRIIGVTNKTAFKLIHRIRLFVFSENYNRYAYETEIKTGTSFDIYNEDAVDKLLKEDPKLLPEWKIDEEKDYTWNRQKVENAVTQGIIQGESVDQIADRLAKDLASTNLSKMRMFARTAVTGAQNAGRQKQMEDAVKMGIDVRKQWIATLDSRTRDTHQHLDGQIVNVDESFHVGTKHGTAAIRYPGDPDAEPALVYNCRCTMKSVLKAMEGQKRTRRAYREKDGRRESYLIEDMTYDEWKKWKEGRGE